MTESELDGTVELQGQIARHVWPAEARQLTAIRAEMRRWLASLGLPDDEQDDLILAVSEAATNAIEHGYRGGDPPAGSSRPCGAAAAACTSRSSTPGRGGSRHRGGAAAASGSR